MGQLVSRHSFGTPSAGGAGGRERERRVSQKRSFLRRPINVSESRYLSDRLDVDFAKKLTNGKLGVNFTMYELKYKKKALKIMRKMPNDVRDNIKKELKEIALDPYGYEGDWKPLTGMSGWRLRVGGYRAICDVQDEALIVLVLKVGPRGDVYK